MNFPHSKTCVWSICILNNRNIVHGANKTSQWNFFTKLTFKKSEINTPKYMFTHNLNDKKLHACDILQNTSMQVNKSYNKKILKLLKFYEIHINNQLLSYSFSNIVNANFSRCIMRSEQLINYSGSFPLIWLIFGCFTSSGKRFVHFQGDSPLIKYDCQIWYHATKLRSLFFKISIFSQKVT